MGKMDNLDSMTRSGDIFIVVFIGGNTIPKISLGIAGEVNDV
jgi:hypothetical protein